MAIWILEHGVRCLFRRISNKRHNTCDQCFRMRPVWCGNNVALGKPATSSSVWGGYAYLAASNMVDGDANPNDYLGHCFVCDDGAGGPNWAVVDLLSTHHVDRVDLYSKDCCAERLDYFIIGLTSVNYFQSWSSIIRGAYPICAQYKYKAVNRSKHTLNANVMPISLPTVTLLPSNLPMELDI
ncbi:hypothetical protein HELRODRAFT_159690 [Helobdella robusta]|uniref:F5/8 type C domain-containing protein n=1 Tax=Helobdella robusta TaxID=6412 RepID=T1EPB2_HELRO|nr:hypothetical protein HELRODRAFT_159690 [Helobdella robusta]ESO13086.1 hypothetical protein HELRODRAFT_159690 [Helobdella robusta]